MMIKSYSISDLMKILLNDHPVISKPVYGELEFINRSEKESGSRLRDFKFSSRYSFIESFLDDISNNISFIEDHEIMDRKFGYQFPSMETLEVFHKETDLDVEHSFINENDHVVDKAVLHIYDSFSDKKPERKNIALTGVVGSGKSTFIRYFIKKYMGSEKRDKNTYVIVTYEDVKSKFGEIKSKEEWVSCFEKKVIDQVVYRCIDGMMNDNDEEIPRLLKKWIDVRSQLDGYSTETIDSVKKICNLFSNEDFREQWDDNWVRHELKEEIKQILFKFIVKSQGYKVFIIFDGFDAFSLDKIINENNKEVVSFFSDTIFKGKKIASMDHCQYCCIISLRDSTFSRMMKILNPEDGECIDRWRICPPGVKRSIYRGIESYFKHLSKCNPEDDYEKKINEIKKGFVKVIDKLHLMTKKEFSSDDDEMANIFNQNYRRLKDYYILLIRHLVSELIEIKGDFDDIYEFIDEVNGLNLHSVIKTHDLIELLILKDSKSFFNYFSSLDMDSGVVHGETNQRRGLVDNIFCYSFPDYQGQSEIPLTLVKLRMLQYLSANKYSMTSSLIQKELESLGYLIGDDEVLYFLHLLEESGFIRSRWSDEKRTITYMEAPLGLYAINSIISSSRYLEHVIQKTLLPTKIHEIMHPMCKYTKSDNYLKTWIHNSVINLYIFSEYISLLESHEIDNLSSDEDIENFEITYSLKGARNSVLASLRYVFRSNFGRQLNIKSLYIDIEDAKKQLERILGQ